MSTEVLARIQHAARFGRIILSGHAREEMANANCQAHDVRQAILTATAVITQGTTSGDTRYRLEGGRALDGEGLVVVVREIQPGLFVVTVF